MRAPLLHLAISLLVCLPSLAKGGYSESFAGPTTRLLHQASKKAKRTIYVDAVKGDDMRRGNSPTQAVQSLLGLDIQDGDQILLMGGQKHVGCIELVGRKNITLGSYGKTKATIDCAGYPAGVLVQNCSDIKIADLTITGDGGPADTQQMNRDADRGKDYRYGIFLYAKQGMLSNIEIDNVNIQHVYYYSLNDKAMPSDIRPCRAWSTNEINHYGWGIRGISQAGGKNQAGMENISINNCHISDVSRTGIQMNGNGRAPIKNLSINRSSILHVGGPGLQFSHVYGAVLAHSRTYCSGSSNDKRKWGRGSGIWTHSCQDFVMQYCRFERAEGIADCCGAHIDIGNKNVIIQNCLSKDNAGGFIEILGKNQNCSYRYNISINDGWRNMKDAKQADCWRNNKKPADSKILGTAGCLMTVNGHTSGQYIGPYYSYIYNNTIVCSKKRKDGYTNPFVLEIATSTEGTLVMNNIFWVPEPMTKGWSSHKAEEGGFINNAVDFRITTGQLNAKGAALVRDMNTKELAAMNLVFRNNLYKLYNAKYPLAENLLPHNEDIAESELRYRDEKALGGTPRWSKSQDWQDARDLIPQNKKLIYTGAQIKKLSSDPSKEGLPGGLKISTDFFGRPLARPILGACAPIALKKEAK